MLERCPPASTSLSPIFGWGVRYLETDGRLRSASSRRVARSLRSAMASARLTAVSVLPSDGTALVTTMTCGVLPSGSRRFSMRATSMRNRSATVDRDWFRTTSSGSSVNFLGTMDPSGTPATTARSGSAFPTAKAGAVSLGNGAGRGGPGFFPGGNIGRFTRSSSPPGRRAGRQRSRRARSSRRDGLLEESSSCCRAHPGSTRRGAARP